MTRIDFDWGAALSDRPCDSNARPDARPDAPTVVRCGTVVSPVLCRNTVCVTPGTGALSGAGVSGLGGRSGERMWPDPAERRTV